MLTFLNAKWALFSAIILIVYCNGPGHCNPVEESSTARSESPALSTTSTLIEQPVQLEYSFKEIVDGVVYAVAEQIDPIYVFRAFRSEFPFIPFDMKKQFVELSKSVNITDSRQVYELVFDKGIRKIFIDIMMEWVRRNVPNANPNWNLPELYESLKMNTMYTWRNLAPCFINLPANESLKYDKIYANLDNNVNEFQQQVQTGLNTEMSKIENFFSDAKKKIENLTKIGKLMVKLTYNQQCQKQHEIVLRFQSRPSTLKSNMMSPKDMLKNTLTEAEKNCKTHNIPFRTT